MIAFGIFVAVMGCLAGAVHYVTEPRPTRAWKKANPTSLWDWDPEAHRNPDLGFRRGGYPVTHPVPYPTHPARVLPPAPVHPTLVMPPPTGPNLTRILPGDFYE